MARLAAGHFSIHPDDLDGREMVTTVRTATDGELNVEFKATIHMEMSAFQRLAEKKFKGVYWLSEKPVVAESGDSNKSAGSNQVQEALPFAVYVLNDLVNTIDHVSKTLEDVCSLSASEASAATMTAHRQAEAVVFKARTEDEALEVQAKLHQAGLKTQIRRTEG